MRRIEVAPPVLLAHVLEAPTRIATAIGNAARSTGIPFEYLLATAARESSFQATAKAKDSSAAGLFQFIESTWLKTVKDDGTQFGLGGYADQIVKTDDGRYVVPDAKARADILRLRYDPAASANLAAAFTQDNADILAEKLDRAPTVGELYIAHFMGADRGAQLIGLARNAPDQRADGYFPKQARANRGIFYSAGRPRSLSQVYQALVNRHDAVEMAYRPADTTIAADASTTADAPAQEPRSPLQSFKVAALTDKVLDVEPDLSPALGSVGAWGAIAQASARSQAQTASVTGADAVKVRTDAAATTDTGVVKARRGKAVATAQRAAKNSSGPSARVVAAKRLRQAQPSRVNIASSSFTDFDENFWSDLGRMPR